MVARQTEIRMVAQNIFSIIIAGFIQRLKIVSTICNIYIYILHIVDTVGRDRVFGLAAFHELDGPGIDSWWEEFFLTRPDRPRVPPSLLYNDYHISFLDVKRPGRSVDYQPPSRAEVREKVQLYIYSPSATSRPVLG